MPCVWLNVCFCGYDCVCVYVHIVGVWVFFKHIWFFFLFFLSPALTGVCTLCLLSFCKGVSDCACMCGRPGISWYLCRSVCPFFLSLSVPPTCLWHTCVVLGLTPAFVNRGRRRAPLIGAQEGREKGLHSEKPPEMRKRWTDGEQEEEMNKDENEFWERWKDDWIWIVCGAEVEGKANRG